MIRKIIEIDENKCNGCGLCVEACHEGAIGLIDGKAKLLRDDYCDGLGDCLPACPTGAISFTEREAKAYDEKAVQKNKEQKKAPALPENKPLPCGCPGTNSRPILHKEKPQKETQDLNVQANIQSRLNQWPVQLKLVPINAAYFNNADLLISADCAAYAYGNFHTEFIKDRITLIGCPKLDEGDYTEKLTAILKQNNIKSITIVRMEVPCCGGIANAAINALKNCGKMIPWNAVTISTDGQILK